MKVSLKVELFFVTKVSNFWRRDCFKSALLLPVFIQRRVQTIKEIPNVKKQYVTSQENIADLPTRGANVEDITKVWFHGPHWLRKSAKYWPPALPTSELLADEIFETQIPATIAVITTPTYPFQLDAKKYSNYMNLIRVTTILIRFVNSFKLIQNRQIFAKPVSNFTAQQMWIAYEQKNYYDDVIYAITNRKKHELVSKLNLYLDVNNIIRCAGRFQNAPLTKNEKNPILLPPPKSSKFVTLLIEFYHQTVFHAGALAVLTQIRRKYWIPAGRRAIQNVLRNCVKCKRYTSRSYHQPQESMIPEFRFQEHCTPFENIGIDTFGPIWVNTEKRFVLLVTDLVIRAVDLELLQDMTAEVIFLALRTIIARRIQPKLIVSDNAPQFHIIKKLLEAIYVHPWEWKFIPEHAPWEGGVYERLVGLSKAALLKTFHNRGTTDIALRTTLAEIAKMLNDRPLTFVSNDTETIEPLTPNHFLKSYYPEAEFSKIITPAEATISQRQLVNLAKCCKATNEHFWSLWKREYLQFLREKGFRRNEKFPRSTTIQPPQVGDVVLIAEKNIKRSSWKLGKVISLNISSDGKIRSVMLKTAHGILVRPLIELYPLEISIENSNRMQNSSTPDPVVECAPAASHMEDTEHESDDEWDNVEVEEQLIYVDA